MKKFNIFFAILLILILVLLANSQVTNAQENQQSGISVAGIQAPDSKSESIIKFSVAKESSITLNVFDAYNNLVKIVVYDDLQPGIYEYDMRNQLPIGKYTCKLNSGESSDSFDLVLK